MAAPVLHADGEPSRRHACETDGEPDPRPGPVPARPRPRHRVKQGRVWAYVSDQRPWAGTAPPGVISRFSADRKGEHPRQHLQGSSGILQADAYAGLAQLYERCADGSQFREAAYWAHPRRDFHDVRETTKSEIAREALDRIGKLHDVERQISGQPAELRKAARQQHSRPRVDAFKA